MKKILLFSALLLTACETVCRPDASFVRSDLSLKAQSMVQGPAAKIFTPIVKAEIELPKIAPSGQKIVMPKPEIYTVARAAKTEKVNATTKMEIEKLEGEILTTNKIDMMPTASISTPVLTFRFPEAKDALTAYEQARLKVAIKPEVKKITVTVAPDLSRTGFELIVAVKKRSDLIKSFLPKSAEVFVTFAPQQEANTVRIDAQ